MKEWFLQDIRKGNRWTDALMVMLVARYQSVEVKRPLKTKALPFRLRSRCRQAAAMLRSLCILDSKF